MRSPNVLKIGHAVGYPGIDPRTWSCTGRLSENSAQWDEQAGWLVEVDIYGGALDGNEGTVARWLTATSGDGYGEFIPPVDNAEVLLQLPDGDADSNPIVIGYACNQNEDTPDSAPTSIHGLPIDGEVDASNDTTVSPYDTHIFRTGYIWRGEFGSLWAIDADLVKLGAAADQSAIRGDEYNEQIVAIVDNLVTVLTQLATDLDSLLPTPPPPQNVTNVTNFSVQLETVIKPALLAALSKKVKLE
jgi:hypothetical protein